jgi:hypothetical protein
MPNGAPRALEAGRVTVAVSAVDWLLESDEPGIVAQARRDLLDAPDPEAEARVLEGLKVRSLLAGQRPDGGFGVNVYGSGAARTGGSSRSSSSACRRASRAAWRPRRRFSPG